MKKTITFLGLSSCIVIAMACGSTGNGGGGDAGPDAASSGSGGSSSSGHVGASSSGSGSGSSGSSSGGNSSSSSSGSTGDGGLSVAVNTSACTKSLDCPTGQVCCGALGLAGLGMITLTSRCQAAACPPQLPINAPIQFCSMTSECPGGTTCSPPSPTTVLLVPGVASDLFCNAFTDGGDTPEASTTESGSGDAGSDAGPGSDGSPADAAEGG